MTDAPDARIDTGQTAAAAPPLVHVEPHRWALSWWARLYRRLARQWHVTRHVQRFCRPLTVEGRENFDSLDNPVILIANHTSHFDTAIVLALLPMRIYSRTAIAAAADRMYRDRLKGMLNSLRYNSFPITRGGGRQALAYSQWLLHNGWSLLIFPEGKRSRTGDLQPFHIGPALLALGENAPVLPIYIQGAMAILPPGTKYARPAPVHVRIGQPLTFAAGTSPADCKQMMEDAVRALAS